ncbi:alpha/beta fold hydrolase [Microbacterium sp. ZW T5_56]|uniref:alpha/beta fold hydrolase n=1 Tax=Microbacterium sp. ZW T5_56 TaxID=3378081 RepID=UPI0038523E6A
MRLHVREYGTAGGPEVLAIHGITAHGGSWAAVSALLPQHRVIAPDLRGRAGSRDLPGPFGLRRHADDLAALLRARGGAPRVVTGHSMGAFVAVALASAYPELVERLVLVDGGLPLELPEGATPTDTARLLGPAAERLQRTFAHADEYLDFWRAHPAIGPYWPATWDAYARDDLIGAEPELRASASAAAMIADGTELYGPDWYLAALRSLRMPVSVLRAPRGLLDADPLYPCGAIEAFRSLIPQLHLIEVDDVNHYTVLFSDRGAAVVAQAIEHP